MNKEIEIGLEKEEWEKARLAKPFKDTVGEIHGVSTILYRETLSGIPTGKWIVLEAWSRFHGDRLGFQRVPIAMNPGRNQTASRSPIEVTP